MKEDYISISELPGGFSVREAVLADATAVADLANLCDIAVTGLAEFSVAELLTEWEAPDFDLSLSRIVTTEEGNVVGYADLYYPNIPVRNYLWCKVHPEYRSKGIGTFLLKWGEATTQKVSKAAPAESSPEMLTSCHEKEADAVALFKENGLALERRYYTMQIELDEEPPQPVWPENIRLTTFSEYNDLAAIWRTNNEAFRDHYGHTERPEEEGVKNWQHIIDTAEHFDSDLWFIALDGDEIAGICLCRPRTNEDKDKGHVDNLGVRRPWRKKGLGKALLLHAFGEFYKRGKKKVDLGVDATSLTGATRLYEKAGMKAVHVYESYAKPIERKE